MNNIIKSITNMSWKSVSMVICIAILLWIIVNSMCFGCSNLTIQEGFELANKLANTVNDYTPSKTIELKGMSESTLTGSKLGKSQINKTNPPSSWYLKNPNTITPNEPLSKDPLMFEKTKFKPECCPSTYSNADGCACMTTNQINYLADRGGNNVPYSTL